MGSQQIVIYILVILLVTIAVTQGYAYYVAYSQNNNRDQLFTNINILYNSAKEYKSKPSSLGGGNGSYLNWQPNSNLFSPDIGTIKYKVYDDRINFLGTGIALGNNDNESVKVFVRFRDDKKDFIRVLN